MSKGFTLIELLLVVLIIGILSAVALPQYQKAVQKSRISSALPVLKTIHEAAQRYYMSNGEYPEKIEDLDVQWPAGAISKEDLGNQGEVYIYSNGLQYNLCPQCQSVRVLGSTGVTIDFYFATHPHFPNKLVCWSQDICKSFTAIEPISIYGSKAYILN